MMRHHHRFVPVFFGFGYPFFPFYGFWPYGYGYGYGYGGYGYGYPYYGYNSYGTYGSYLSDGDYAATDTVPVDPNAEVSSSDAQVFAEKGEADFKNGDYKAAAYALRHAVLDDPRNGVVVMMLAQALFATGQYDDAAGATQQAMQLLPEDQWGVVVTNYRELYTKIQDYSDQLKALEKAVKEHGDDPGMHFLLGFHYGYLGYPSHAVKQLDKTIALASQDELAKKLRDLMAAKMPKPADAGAKAASGDQQVAQDVGNGDAAGGGDAPEQP